MKRLWRHESGDTIVEVLVAIVIVATILGGAYATANRSLLATRESQERGEALTLAEGQVEALRGLAATASPTDAKSIFNNPDIFCILAGGIVAPQAMENSSPVGPYTIGNLPSASSDNDTNYTNIPAMPPVQGGSPCAVNPQGSGYKYDVAIERCNSSNDNGNSAYPDCASYNEPSDGSELFIVHVRWDSTGGGRNEATLQYRIYEASS